MICEAMAVMWGHWCFYISLQVFLVASLISFMFRRDVDTDPYEEKYGEMQDSVDVFGQGNSVFEITHMFKWVVVLTCNLWTWVSTSHIDVKRGICIYMLHWYVRLLKDFNNREGVIQISFLAKKRRTVTMEDIHPNCALNTHFCWKYLYWHSPIILIPISLNYSHDTQFQNVCIFKQHGTVVQDGVFPKFFCLLWIDETHGIIFTSKHECHPW